MKYFIFSILASFFAQSIFACDRPIDEKKVVIYMGFHGGGEEIKGAIEGACLRGEQLVTIPDMKYLKDFEKQKSKLNYNKFQAAAIKAYSTYLGCVNKKNPSCDSESKAYEKKANELEAVNEHFRKWVDEHADKREFLAVLTEQLQTLKSKNAHVSSLILSGHDGAGHFYGDSTGITKEQIFALTNKYPKEIGSMSSVLLMGCWSSVPKEVDEWKTAFPALKIIGGFVGSAPSSERPEAAHFISDILSNESKVGKNSTQSSVKNVIDSIRDLKMVTSGVYIDNSKSGCSGIMDNKNQFYYVSPALNENEVDTKLVGLHPYTSTASSEAELQCRMFAAQYAWDTLDSYFSGDKEPENTPELRSLYSSLRNHDHCISKGYIQPRYNSEQVLFLRFFKDMKKNFVKYFDKQLQEAASAINKIDKNKLSFSAQNALEKYLKNPLTSNSILKMNRKEVLDAISNLNNLTWNIGGEIDSKSRKLVELANRFLYRMDCMDPTWHEYIEGEKLIQPQCGL